jgi:hypothetical protein
MTTSWRCRGSVTRVLASTALVLVAAAVMGQDFWFRAPLVVSPNAEYDGRFRFARLKYTTGLGGYYYGGLPAWAHGYPGAERNLMRVLNGISCVGPDLDRIGVLALDDPELLRYPVAYMTEPGYWTMTDDEALGFRAYLQKGGFVIFDDFRNDAGGAGWSNFVEQMRRVIPDERFLDLDLSHPVFHSLFDIPSLDTFPQYYDLGRPVFRGLFEENDPTRRLMAVVNFNTDLSNFWEFSETGAKPLDESSDAYELAVNYVVYGLTH